MKRIFSACLLILLVVAAVPARAAEQAIYVAPTDTPGLVTVHVVIPYEAETPGLAHYAEHLVWLSALGGEVRLGDPHSNAFTSSQVIAYFMSGPSAELNAMLTRLARVFLPITLDHDFALEERGIVEREYDLRVAEKPDERAFEQMNPFLYDGNSLAVSVLGTATEIRALQVEDAKKFQEATHKPERAMLFVEGDITEDQIARALADTKFPEMRPASTLKVPPALNLAPPAEKVVRDPSEGAAPRMLWSKLVALPEPDSYDLLVFQANLLSDILISALDGGLAKPLRYDAFMARVFDVRLLVYDERHVEFFVSAEPDAGVGFAALREAVETALGQSAKGIPKPTYERALRRFRAAVPDPADRPANLKRMAEYRFDRLLRERPMLDEQGLRDLMDQIEPGAIDRLAAALTAPGRTAVAFIGKDPAK